MFSEDAVQVTEHYSAERTANKYNVVTYISWREPGSEIRRNHIDVSSSRSLEFEDPTESWSQARVNWSALGTVPVSVATEFAQALTWAVEEAARIDALLANPAEESVPATP